MKRISISLFVGSLLSISTVSLAQTSTSPAEQLFGKVDKAFAGTASVSSVVLSGEVHAYAGSQESSGQATLTARADGSSSVALQLDSGNRSESQDAFANGQGCTWSGSDGVAQTVPAHNCMVPVAWFLPQVSLFSAQQPSNGTLSLGASQGTGQVLHWALISPGAASPQLSSLLPSIGSYDLYVDTSTYLPSSLSYSVHPDANAGVDIAASVVYSDYRSVSGISIPFHIQRYLNGTLSLDVTLSNAVIAN